MGTMQQLIEATGVKVVGPNVNLNGTRGKDLMDQILDAGHAVRKAMDVLSEAAPNGRDYLPQGAGEYPIAAKQHADRLARIKSVYDELQDVAELIADQL
jgi:hypothetical protein